MKRALTLLLLCVIPEARAAVDPPTPATCTVKGKLRKRVEVYSAATAGTQLLTTHFLYDRNYEIYEFPGDTKTGRVHARSSRDVPGLRIDGFIAAEDFLFTAAKDQPVIVDHVWLAAGASLRLFATKNALEADAMGSPFANTRTHVECADLRLGRSGPTALAAKGSTVVFKSKTVKLLDAAGGKLVFTLKLLDEPSSLRITSTQTQGAFQKIEVGAPVRVSGWVASGDLDAPPTAQGMSDIGTGGGTAGTFGKMMKPSKAAKHDTEVYLSASTTGPVAAILEKDARVFPSYAEGGFSKIKLVDNDASPPDGKDFYVSASALQ
jgi:hypothetical protein